MTVRRNLRGLALPILGLVLWSAAGLHESTGSSLFVTPADVGVQALQIFGTGSFWASLAESLLRALTGLLVGGGLGLSAGIALGVSRRLRLTFDPTLQTLKNISLFAWIPLIMAWFGLAEVAKIALVALATFFPMFLNSLEGVRSVPRPWVELGRSLAYSHGQMVRRIVVPAALPSIFTGLHLALVYAWLATLGAEYMLTSGGGIGNLLNDAREDLRIDHILVYIAVTGGVGFLLSALADRLERALTGNRSASAPPGRAAI